jgi:transcriptional regulator with XRE-family HTH domain
MSEPLSPAAQLFGERVRTIRIELGLSQETMAALAQMHVTNYGKIERGTANPSLVTILRIASVLGSDVAALTEGIIADHLPEGFTVVTANEFIRERDRRRREPHRDLTAGT